MSRFCCLVVAVTAVGDSNCCTLIRELGEREEENHCDFLR